MTPNEYQEQAMRTMCDQHKAGANMVPCEDGPAHITWRIQLNHSLLGILGEGGELATIMQRLVYYGKQIPTEELLAQMKEEFGDLLWYIAEGVTALGLTMQDVMESNIRKLKARYPEKYTDQLADEDNRNRIAERDALVAKNKENLSQTYTDTFFSGHVAGRVTQDGHGFGHKDSGCPCDFGTHEWELLQTSVGSGRKCRHCGTVEAN